MRSINDIDVTRSSPPEAESLLNLTNEAVLVLYRVQRRTTAALFAGVSKDDCDQLFSFGASCLSNLFLQIELFDFVAPLIPTTLCFCNPFSHTLFSHLTQRTETTEVDAENSRSRTAAQSHILDWRVKALIVAWILALVAVAAAYFLR